MKRHCCALETDNKIVAPWLRGVDDSAHQDAGFQNTGFLPPSLAWAMIEGEARGQPLEPSLHVKNFGRPHDKPKILKIGDQESQL